MLIYLRPQIEQLPWGLHVVQVSVEVGEENGDLTSRQQEVCDLGHGDKVGDVRLAGRGCAPGVSVIQLLSFVTDAID